MSYEHTEVTNTTMVKETATPIGGTAATQNGYDSDTDFAFTVGGTTYKLTQTDAQFTVEGFLVDQKILISTTSGLNDGVYTVIAAAASELTLEEPVTAETNTEAGTVTIHTIEIFEITPTRRMGQLCITIYNHASHNDITYSLAAGPNWAAKGALTGTALAASGYTLLFVETAPYLQSDAKLLLTLTPADTKDLLAEHTAKVGFIELP